MHPILQNLLESSYPNEIFSATGPRIKSSSGNSFYAKVGTPSNAEQYTGEVESLQAMSTASPSLVPKVIEAGTDPDSGKPYMISEYFDLSPLTKSGASILAKRLATELHAPSSIDRFGFAVPTYCGVTRLPNGWNASWDAAFGSLIGTLLDGLEQKAGFDELVRLGRDTQTRSDFPFAFQTVCLTL